MLNGEGMEKKKLIEIVSYLTLAVVFLTSCITIILSAGKRNIAPEQEIKSEMPYDEIGEKIEESVEEESSYFPQNLLSPFVDMVAWVSDYNYGINGVPNLGAISDDCGSKYYCLGFIRTDDNGSKWSDGRLKWGWGSYADLSEKGNDGYQYEGIKKAINDVKKRGGDVIVSFGGQLGKSPWTVTQNQDDLYNMYMEVIDAYDLKRIDLDIEESNQDYDNNFANAMAVKRVQEDTGVEVVLTIPIMPYGWDTKQVNLIRAYIDGGVKISLINNMTMCYGYGAVGTNETFGDASVRALKNAQKQLVKLCYEYGVEISEEDAYKMLGATVDIGYENASNPVFTVDETAQVAQFAKENNLGMFSFWSMNRDAMLEQNRAISSKFDHFTASTYYLDK